MSDTVASARSPQLLRTQGVSAVLPESELLELLSYAAMHLDAQAGAIDSRGENPVGAAALRNTSARLRGPASGTVRRLFRRAMVGE